MSKEITVEKFINKAVYDPHGQVIFGEQENGHLQLLLDVRGWGAIQNLSNDQNEAAKFQDKLGEWITDAINKKLERCEDIDIKNHLIDEQQQIEKDASKNFGGL